MYRVRASYSPFRAEVRYRAFRTFICAWWWAKQWTWVHPFSQVLIEKGK